MRKVPIVIVLFILSCSLSGCGLMEDAFKAGVIFAIIVVAIIALLVWLARMVAKYVMQKFSLSSEETSEMIKKTDESSLKPQRIRVGNKI